EIRLASPGIERLGDLPPDRQDRMQRGHWLLEDHCHLAPAQAAHRVFRQAEQLGLSEDAMRRLRGREMAMIFQEPMTSLHPILPVRRQITETLDAGRGQADL